MKKLIITSVIFFYLNLVYGIDPIKDYIKYPSNVGLDYEEIYIKNSDTVIYCWLTKAKVENKNLIILSYPDYGNMSYYLEYVRYYIEMGFDVLTYDYRGFGKSSDFKIDKNYLFYYEFVDDLKNVFNYSKQNFNYNKIGLLGLSMGTIISAYATTEIKNIDFMILDGCVYSISKVFERLNKKDLKAPVSEEFNFLSELWRDIDTKLLILSASEDTITTADDALSIISYNKSKRKTFSYRGKHLGFLNRDFNKSEFKHYFLWVTTDD